MEQPNKDIQISTEQILWTVEKYLKDNPNSTFMDALVHLDIIDSPVTIDDESLVLKVMSAWNNK